MALYLNTWIFNIIYVLDPHIHDVLRGGTLAVQFADFVSPHDSLVRADLIPMLFGDGARYLVVLVWSTNNRACQRRSS